MQVAKDKIVAGAFAVGVVAVMVTALASMPSPVRAAAEAVVVPAMVESSASKAAVTSRSETVVFAGGCFWGVQGVFAHVKGVKRAVSGYIGGAASTAHYEVVSTGVTGHAEAVQVTFDPSQVSYPTLMRVFFSVAHDPTQLNQQYPDHGTQYRSAIYASTPAQVAASKAYIAQLQKARVFKSPIVTQVASGKPFYAAEGYHQNYMVLNPDAAYIRYYDAPKVAALKRVYPSLYRGSPVLVGSR